jgi:hypothetical protein
MQLIDRALLFRDDGRGGWEQELRKLPGGLDAERPTVPLAAERPEQGARNDEHSEGSEYREIELDVQAAHREQLAAAILLAREDVARAAHGQDPSRLLWVVLDRGADPEDVDVDRAVELFERAALSSGP